MVWKAGLFWEKRGQTKAIRHAKLNVNEIICTLFPQCAGLTIVRSNAGNKSKFDIRNNFENYVTAKQACRSGSETFVTTWPRKPSS